MKLSSTISLTEELTTTLTFLLRINCSLCLPTACQDVLLIFAFYLLKNVRVFVYTYLTGAQSLKPKIGGPYLLREAVSQTILQSP